MIKGRVIGKIWSSRRVTTLPSGALLEVETDGGGKLIAFDPLGCNAGEAVLVTQGSVAAVDGELSIDGEGSVAMLAAWMRLGAPPRSQGSSAATSAASASASAAGELVCCACSSADRLAMRTGSSAVP